MRLLLRGKEAYIRAGWIAVCGLALFAVGCGGGGGVGQIGDGNGTVGGTSIRGRVVEAVSRQPIENATVTVGGRSTRTSADGRFSLAVDPGERTISVSAQNFLAGTFNTIVEPNQQVDVGDLGLSDIDSGPPPPPI
jgi:hypothetical protein